MKELETLRRSVDEAVTRHRIVEHDGRERVAEAFAEGDARIELVAEAMRAADVVGAREVVFDVVAELVRDHVLIEFIGVFGEVREQRDVLARHRAVKNVPSVWLPQSTISAGKLVVGRDAEDGLYALVDRVENGERPGGACCPWPRRRR